MVYDFNTGRLDNFAWASIIDPLSNLFGSGLDKINDTKHTIADMWKEYQDTRQAQAQALALQKQLEAQKLQAQQLAATQREKQKQMLIIGGIVAVAIIVILLIVLNR